MCKGTAARCMLCECVSLFLCDVASAFLYKCAMLCVINTHIVTKDIYVSKLSFLVILSYSYFHVSPLEATRG
jgi:hypothetical protein